MAKGIAILGCTGSIGRQTLDVCDAHPEDFRVIALGAGKNVILLEEQVRKYRPKAVVIADKSREKYLRDRLADLPVVVYGGSDNLVEIVTLPDVQMVVMAVTGAVGLVPTVEAIKAGKDIAIANKETLVAAGELVMEMAKKYKCQLLPVDSEHSALFQCLQGNKKKEVEKLILTASGGPFLGKTQKQLAKVTSAEALKHPSWSMGAKITIDSATLMNKGLEVIEARYLFDINYDQIEVIVHPQSIIHSMVEYKDGSILAQLGMPDMRIPIQYALTWPERKEGIPEAKLNLLDLDGLTFETPDYVNFPALSLAYEAGKAGGNMPAALNAANEEAVHGFLQGKLSFLTIIEIVAKVLEEHKMIYKPNLEEILATDRLAREKTAKWISQYAM